MTKPAKDLLPGEKINPPSHERTWLKTPLTVVSVEEGTPDKRGPWLNVRVTFVSPYDAEKISVSVFRFRPDTIVKILS